MRRTLRLFLCQCLVAGLAFPLTAAAQETRGKISGTVRDNAGVIPGASVKITNIDTSVTQNVTTNDSGYFEASFLIPGTYAVSVQMAGYKGVVRDHLTVGVGEQLSVPLTFGFERDPAKTPAAFQKRAFPFRIDGVRSMPLTFTNLSILRSFAAGHGRTVEVRVDAQNLFNRQQWLGPSLNPTSTQFGQVTAVALNQMRFFTFGLRATF